MSEESMMFSIGKMLFEKSEEIGALRANNDVLVEALGDLLRWSHWANEKLGFGFDPLFPEYKKAKEALKKAVVKE